MEFIDSHCHLDFARIGELNTVIAQAQRRGVRRFVVPSVDANNWTQVLTLSQTFPSIYAALGVHPYFLRQDNQLKRLTALAHSQRQQIVAIGEIGLDGSLPQSLEQQLAVLKPQLALAKELALPVICHAHKAYDPLLKQLRQYQLAHGGVIHGFSGSLVQANEFIKLGFKLGVGGVITYSRAKKTRQMFTQVGLEHLLLETDSPDMPIAGHQGQVNTPQNIIHIAQDLAVITKNSLATVAQVTSQNTAELFNL